MPKIFDQLLNLPLLWVVLMLITLEKGDPNSDFTEIPNHRSSIASQDFDNINGNIELDDFRKNFTQ